MNELRPRGPVNRAIDPTAAQQRGVGGIDNRIHGQGGDIGLYCLKCHDDTYGITWVMQIVQQWRRAELTLTAQKNYRRPFTEVAIEARFTGPRGQKLTRPAFWDGGDTWRVRVALPTVGRWRFETVANSGSDVGLHGQRGELVCVPYSGALPIYQRGFLTTGKRHLSYRDGTPFFWLADTHWLWESEPFETVFKPMADKRIAQGFGVYQVEFFTRWKGDAPDVAHFQANTDPKWAYLAEQGIVVAATHGLLERPATPKTAEREAAMARYLCARYGAYPAVWLMFQECTGHYAKWFKSEAERLAFLETVRAVGKAYKAADGYHQPRTAHSDAPLKTAYRGEDWLDFTLLQGGHAATIDREPYFDLYFDPKHTLPQIEGEANYEQLFEGADKGSPKAITVDAMREKAYQAMQCGCAGYTYGANGVWQAVLSANNSELHKVYGRTLWSVGINLPGGEQLAHWRTFYSSLPWHRLQPRPDCDGFATWDAQLPPSQRPALSCDPERNTIVVYFFTGTPLTGTLHHLQDTDYRAQWFNPRTGQFSLPPAPRPAGGSFRVPPKPDASDWVLLLRAVHPKTKASPVPFRWAAIQKAREAERARNVAPKATITASTTDWANKVYHPKNAVDGNTAVSDWQHWSSDGTAPLPAWLQLEWPQPVRITKLRLFFMRDYEVQDYAIEADGTVIFEVKGNTETVREHALPKALTLRKLRFVGKRGPKLQPSIIRLVELEALR